MRVMPHPSSWRKAVRVSKISPMAAPFHSIVVARSVARAARPGDRQLLPVLLTNMLGPRGHELFFSDAVLLAPLRSHFLQDLVDARGRGLHVAEEPHLVLPVEAAVAPTAIVELVLDRGEHLQLVAGVLVQPVPQALYALL